MFSRRAAAIRGKLEAQYTRPSISASASSVPSRFSLPQQVYLHESTLVGGGGNKFQASPQEVLPDRKLSSNKPAPTATTTSSSLPSSRSCTTQDLPSPLTTIPATPTAAKSTRMSSLSSPSSSILTTTTENYIPENKLPIRPTSFSTPLTIRKSVAELLPYLTNEGNIQGRHSYFISAHLHARPYLLTEGDHIQLPFRMPNVKPGDILRFNRATAIGSRDFTLKGTPYIDERMFECRVRVLGVDSEPMRIKEKTKRRQRHVQRVKSKHRYTLLRVMRLRVKGVEELVQEEGAVILDNDAGGNSETRESIEAN